MATNVAKGVQCPKLTIRSVVRHKYEGASMIVDKLADSDPEVYTLIQQVCCRLDLLLLRRSRSFAGAYASGDRPATDRE